MELPFFYLFSTGIVITSLFMITRSNVIHAALLLVLSFFLKIGTTVAFFNRLGKVPSRRDLLIIAVKGFKSTSLWVF